MSNYYEKEKLLKNNEDLYISDYDKTLHPSALSGIIQSKRDYKTASEKGDNAAMKKANDKANAIRKQFGSYSGGADGSEYNRSVKEYEVRNTPSYKSSYDKKINSIMDQILNMDEFTYNADDDPSFIAYRDLYVRLGEEAFDRALAQNALRSGGVNSTSAISAALGAQNKYNSMLSAKIPELYEAAYKRYKDEYSRLYKQIKTMSDLDDTEYSRYRDSVADFEADRKYFSSMDSDIADRLDNQYKNDTDLMYNIIGDQNLLNYYRERDDKELNYKTTRDSNELDYKKSRDAVEDDRWLAEFDQDNVNIAASLIKSLYGKYPISSSRINAILSYIE